MDTSYNSFVFAISAFSCYSISPVLTKEVCHGVPGRCINLLQVPKSALLSEGSSPLLVQSYIHMKQAVLDAAMKNLSFHPPLLASWKQLEII